MISHLYTSIVGFALCPVLLYAQQETAIDSLKSEYKIALNTEHSIDILNEIAWTYQSSNMDSLFHYSQQALQKSYELNYSSGISWAHGSLFLFHYRKSSLDTAIFNAQKQLEHARYAVDSIQIGKALNNIGVGYLGKSNYRLAADYLHQSISFKTSQLSKMSTLHNVAICYAYLKNHTQAKSLLKEVLNFYMTQDGYESKSFNALIALGDIYKAEDSLKHAEECLDQASEMAVQNTLFQMIVSSEREILAIKKGQCETGLYITNESIKQAKEIGIPILEVQSWLHRAEGLLCLGKYQEALGVLTEMDSILMVTNDVEQLINWYELKIESEKFLGKYDEAITDYESLITIEDSIRNIDHLHHIEYLNTTMYVKEQSNQLALQDTQLQTQQAQIKTRNWMLGGIGISSLLLLLIGYTQYKRRQEKTEAEKEMAVMRGKWEAMETLRGKISKDLHDGVGYNMRLVASQVESLPEQSDMTKTLLQDIRNTDDKIRSIAYELSPGELKNVTLNKAIELHVEKIQASSDITFHLDIFPDDALDSVPPEMATALYRILQECSNNALKHSQATQIEIQFSLLKDGVNFMYEDNGIGFDSENVEEGSGLLNMKTRCMDIGATFHIDAKSGRGTVINIDFPLSLTSK